MTSSKRYLSELHEATAPATERRIAKLERLLKSPLPAQLRALYLLSDGTEEVDARGRERLLPLDDVQAIVEKFRSGEWYGAWTSFGITAFWDFYDSNYAGVYLDGPAKGCVCILDHEDLSIAPRYRSVDAFLAALCENAEAHWSELPTDYPSLKPVGTKWVTHDREVARHFESQFAATPPDDEWYSRVAERWMCVLPAQDAGQLLRHFADSNMWVQASAIELFGLRRDPSVIPQLAEVALHGRGNGQSAAIQALGRIGTQEAIDRLLEITPSLPEGLEALIGHALKLTGRARFQPGKDWQYRRTKRTEWKSLARLVGSKIGRKR